MVSLAGGSFAAADVGMVAAKKMKSRVHAGRIPGLRAATDWHNRGFVIRGRIFCGLNSTPYCKAERDCTVEEEKAAFDYNPGMALVVFLRGVNVGGHRTFRPSMLAKELRDYGVVNVGAAGTFVVQKAGPRAKFCAELLQRLPFETQVMLCDGRDLIRLETENPFGPSRPDIVRFVSILTKADRGLTSFPIALPPRGEWFVRVIGANGRYVFGEYRRHMKTIGYLGQIDKLFGVPATTRNWNTILAIARILKSQGKKAKSD
jgi:uncharacterized protein (DUF1697 family)